METPPPMESPPGMEEPPPDGDPLREADSSIRSTSGRYASYWNAYLLKNKNGGHLRIYLVFVAVKTTRSVQMERPSGVDTSTSTDDFEEYLQSQQENDSHQPVDAFVGT